MKKLTSLSFKIGTIIILVEMIVLTTLGVVYVNRFSNQVDRRIEAQAQLPGVLMNAGLLSFDAVSDPATMRELVGDELITGMVVGVNGNVFYALDPDRLGMDVADIPAVDTGLFDIDNLQDVVIHNPEKLISVSPIFAADQRTPRFFAYTEVSNLGATAEKTALTRLFVFGSLATLLLTSLVIIISFDQMISKRISRLVEILKRVETGDLATRVQEPKSQDEIGFLQRSTNTMIEARQQTEAQIIHLNRVLRAIRNVNQLITQERDLDRLLESACERLTETASYTSAWILLLDDGGTPTNFSRRDIAGHTFSLTDLLERGELMPCLQSVLTQAGVQVIDDEADVCQDCFLLARRSGPYDTMAIRLEYDGKIYGVLNVSVLTEFALDAEECSLFAEVAGDIAFALHTIELEAERIRAENALLESESRLRREKEFTDTALDAQMDTFFLFDPASGKALRWNKAFRDISRYSDEEIASMPVPMSYYGPEDLERARPFVERVMKEGSGTIELELLGKDGRAVPTEYRVSAIYDQEGRPKHFISVGRDISERKQAEEELEKYNEHLEETVAKRTAELRKLVNAMAGREVRMAELKDAIRKLRAQLEEAGLKPVADDPLLARDS